MLLSTELPEYLDNIKKIHIYVYIIILINECDNIIVDNEKNVVKSYDLSSIKKLCYSHVLIP